MTTEVIDAAHRGSRRRPGAGGWAAAPGGGPGAAAMRRSSSRLTYYNTATYWIDHRPAAGGLWPEARRSGRRRGRVQEAVRGVAARMPTYITLKDVKKRWGKGQEDVFPVAQFEKLWGDMTALPELDCRFVVVPRLAGSNSRNWRNWTAGSATARRPIWRGCASGDAVHHGAMRLRLAVMPKR